MAPRSSPDGDLETASAYAREEKAVKMQPVETVLKIANPGPLGLTAFAVTTFTLSMFNAGILPRSVEKVAVPLGYFYGGSVQLLAGLAEIFGRNTFGATAFCSYGAFWIAFGYYVMAIVPSFDGPEKEKVHIATGVFLFTYTVFTTYMAIASIRTFRALTAVFVCLALTFFFLTIGEWGESDGAKKTGGYFGIITSLLAWYCSFGLVLLDTWRYESHAFLLSLVVPLLSRVYLSAEPRLCLLSLVVPLLSRVVTSRLEVVNLREGGVACNRDFGFGFVGVESRQ
ncbi:hypothetical protein CBR_g35019 [Chara braunii]|uniref:GPR1/FUN34/yaaH family protein n=1 Tax=Chara braunii TaxID=69332 RepID=A0A388LK98_CHABU|nr:hypothetical protein CBR_g35019 [Chara braunii]|eukprot:GBG82653.1 hypothetical protein CBR_g35019 [Chara braunii]